MNDFQQPSVTLVPNLVTKRFFTVPKIGNTVDDTHMQARLTEPLLVQQLSKGIQEMRYAAYIRISSEEQIGNFSVDAQRRAIDTWVKAQDGKVVHYYIDEAQSGRTADRPEFLNMRRDAKKRRFDAIVVHKFDRFSRNRTDALAIKSLLRKDYGIKILSVSEPSEDSDGPIGALIEGIMESVADWYSRNLAQETVKGKRERAMQGIHNNNPPFGMNRDENRVLGALEGEIEGVRLAFTLYANGKFSDNRIARILNEKGYITRTGRPFSTDTVRDMLQNRTYIGYVKYQPFLRHADGRRSKLGKVEWFEGKHDPVIDRDLFELCQAVRYQRAVSHDYRPKHRTYLLRGLIYCADCVTNMPSDNQDKTYGHMRPHSNGDYLLYRCRARDFGQSCPQGSVAAKVVDDQVVSILQTLKPPADWRNRMITAMGQLIGDKQLDERLAEIKDIVERMDFRWDNGFIADRDEYLEQRIKLQQELEKLTPIPDDELETAADILENFDYHWNATNGDAKLQQALIQLIVARVWV